MREGQRERLKSPAPVPVTELDGRVIRLEASGFVNLRGSDRLPLTRRSHTAPIPRRRTGEAVSLFVVFRAGGVPPLFFFLFFFFFFFCSIFFFSFFFYNGYLQGTSLGVSAPPGVAGLVFGIAVPDTAHVSINPPLIQSAALNVQAPLRFRNN